MIEENSEKLETYLFTVSVSNKAWTRSNLGNKERIWPIGYRPSWREARGGVQGSHLEQRAWSSTAVRSLLGLCSDYFLTQPRTSSPRVALPTVSWSLPRQSLVKKVPWRTCPPAILVEAFSKLRFSTQMIPACIKLTNHQGARSSNLSFFTISASPGKPFNFPASQMF